MAVTLFAAINVGSYDVEMKIFQYVTRKEFREIDHVRYRIELGKDTYTTGKIGVAKIEELCKVLNDFVKIMNGYKVKAYRACATSAVREAENHLLIVEYVEHMTGIRIEILDNSEQRFLDYKSIAFGEKDFYKIIQKGTAIVEVGGGSVQVCLFDNDKLVTTQNIRIGNLRIREKVADFSRETLHTEEMVEELINNDLESFKKMYLKDRNIKYLIITGDYILELLKKNQVTASEFQKMYEGIIYKHPEEIAKEMDMPVERVREILKISQEPVSLETPIGEEEDSHLGDFIQDDNVPVPAEAAAQTLLKEQLDEVLDTLTEREQKVLRLRFGMNDGRARTLEEVGREFDVTRERIRQIEAKALRKLRHPSRSRKLRDYLD